MALVDSARNKLPQQLFSVGQLACDVLLFLGLGEQIFYDGERTGFLLYSSFALLLFFSTWLLSRTTSNRPKILLAAAWGASLYGLCTLTSSNQGQAGALIFWGVGLCLGLAAVLSLGEERANSGLIWIIVLVFALLWAEIEFYTRLYCELNRSSCPTSYYPVFAIFACLFIGLVTAAVYVKREERSRWPLVALLVFITFFAQSFSDPNALTASLQSTTSNPALLSFSFFLCALRILSGTVSPKNKRSTGFYWGAGGFLILAILLSQMKLQTSLEPVPKLHANETLLIYLLAAEDPTFFYHHAFDFKRLKEDTLDTIESGSLKRGSSTLSMQLAKVRFLYEDKTLFRKLNQMLIAALLEARYSKEEIMAAYLEEIPFGPGVFGLTAAADTYYHTIPEMLSRDQALELVVSIYDPIQYNPSMGVPSGQALSRAAAIKIRAQLQGPQLRRELETIAHQVTAIK